MRDLRCSRLSAQKENEIFYFKIEILCFKNLAHTDQNGTHLNILYICVCQYAKVHFLCFFLLFINEAVRKAFKIISVV